MNSTVTVALTRLSGAFIRAGDAIRLLVGAADEGEIVGALRTQAGKINDHEGLIQQANVRLKAIEERLNKLEEPF